MFNQIIKNILCLLCVIAIFDGKTSNYVKLSQINTENGLSQNGVERIMQDSEGYLWISTPEGINRYDGYRISSLSSPNRALEANPIELVWEDSKGLIWIGAGPNNNFRLDKKNEQLIAISLPLPDEYQSIYPAIIAIEEDENTNLWIATSRGLYFYNREKNHYLFVLSLLDLIDDPENKNIIRTIEKVDDLLVIGTSGGLYSFHTKTSQKALIKHTDKGLTSEDQNNIKLLKVSEQSLLVGTVEGLYQVEFQSLHSPTDQFMGINLIPELNIWQVIEKSDFYWVATDKGLYQYSKGGSLSFIFKYSDTPFDTSDDDIVSMVEDREGNLWFGSRSDGLFKWRPNPAIKKHIWSKGEKNLRLSEDTVYSILKTSEDTTWIGTKNGLTKLDTKNWITSNHLNNPDEKQDLSASTIYSMEKNKGKLWLNTVDGIKVFDQQTMSEEKIIFPETKEKIFSKSVYQVFFISDDILMITNEEGVYKYSLSDNKISLIESTKTKGDRSKALLGFFNEATGHADSYFVAGVDRLLTYSRTNQTLESFHKLPELETIGTFPSDIYNDGRSIWVTYHGYGLYQLDAKTGKEIKFISEASIGANSLMDLFPDKKGNIWITSNDGLLRLNKLNYQVTHYGTKDGFVTSEFNGGTKQILPNGEVLIGSMKGAYLFDPNNVTEISTKTIKPQITGVSLLSSVISKRYSNFNNETIELDYDDFGLNIEFSALLLDKPKQVTYHYWIEGDSKVDKREIKESELFFPSFATGKSQLFISAVDYKNGLESEPVRLFIVSKPAPWLSKIALSGYAAIFLLTILFSYRRYNRRALAKERTHKRIKQSEERLSLALKGSNSGLWDWHAISDSVYEPRLSNIDNDEHIVSFQQRIDSIYFRDQEKVKSKWLEFLNGEDKVFDITYRMREASGQWEWYRDIAMVSEYDNDKIPTRVTGTYTNITEKQQATEKTRLYSKAFENTLDIIIILNQKKKIIAVNDASENIAGYRSEDLIGCSIDELIVSNQKINVTEKIFENIDRNRDWKGEAYLIKKNTVLVSILISATIFLENDTERYYVFSLSDISKQKQAEFELKKLVNYDPLTGLPNRTLLLDRIAHAIPHCKRYNKRLAVFFVDLDKFKQINDSLGHDVGDKLLAKAAKMLRDSCREDDTVARLGGDEFVVMLEDIDSVATINRIVQDILLKMNVPVQIQGNQVNISASIGISIYPQDATEASRLLKHADIAMYHAKSNGRNNFQYFEDYMNRAAQHRLTIENQLRKGVESNEFYLVFQPQFNFRTGEISGVEALARWKTESGENIPPSKFIPVAEDLGLIIPITEKLLQDALNYLEDWNSDELKVKIAFNLSAIHIYDDNFIQFIDDLITKNPEASKMLEFELTESILMEDVDRARTVFAKLEQHGIDLALDDFGTGYSSLKYLSRLPLSKLKIDMSFVSKIGSSFENDAIIKTIISLAKSLNLSTVAEGIENQEQYDFLKQLNVTYAQGYLLSRPLKADDIKKSLFKDIKHLN